MQKAERRAITAIQAGRQVVCTIEEYYTVVRLTLQRYAMQLAAQSSPQGAARVTAEITRLDTALAAGRWPGAYSSRWERLFVTCGRRHAIRWLWRRYYRRAHGWTSQARQPAPLGQTV